MMPESPASLQDALGLQVLIRVFGLLCLLGLLGLIILVLLVVPLAMTRLLCAHYYSPGGEPFHKPDTPSRDSVHHPGTRRGRSPDKEPRPGGGLLRPATGRRQERRGGPRAAGKGAGAPLHRGDAGERTAAPPRAKLVAQVVRV